MLNKTELGRKELRKKELNKKELYRKELHKKELNRKEQSKKLASRTTQIACTSCGEMVSFHTKVQCKKELGRKEQQWSKWVLNKTEQNRKELRKKELGPYRLWSGKQAFRVGRKLTYNRQIACTCCGGKASFDR